MTKRLLSHPYRRGRRLDRWSTRIGGRCDPQPGRRWAGQTDDEGKLTMDLRFATFDLIYHDAVLRPLLVNYADRLEHGHAWQGVPVSSCFVRLRWTAQRSTPAPADAEVLAVEAHMPRHTGSDDGYLQFVLQRLRTTLSGEASAGSITTRCLQASPGVRESPFDTVFATSTFEVALPTTQCRARSPRTVTSWTCWRDVDAASIALGSATPNLN
jgi:hypothetical protein